MSSPSPPLNLPSDSDLGFRVSGFRFRVLGFGFRVSDLDGDSVLINAEKGHPPP